MKLFVVWLACLSRFSVVLLLLSAVTGCAEMAPAPEAAAQAEADEEILSRTAFTDRIENFFEYSPLRSGKPSPFLIHLTDLQDGSPVAEAEVELSVRRSNGEEVVSTRAQIGRVTGIYVAELEMALPGTYEIEFHVRNAILDETMLLAGFLVQ